MIPKHAVVVGYDFSELAKQAIQSALSIASRFRCTDVYLVHVVPLSGSNHPALNHSSVQQALIRQRARNQALQRLDAEELQVPPGITLHRRVRLGPPARELADAAKEVKADMIVVSSHGHGGLKRLVLGSVASALIRVSEVPVLIVGDKRPGTAPFKKVMAAVDLSPVSAAVLRAASDIAEPDAQLQAFSVLEQPIGLYSEGGFYVPIAEELEATREALSKLIEAENLPVLVEVERASSPSQEILSRAIAHDLLVLGTSGHNAWHRMILGATASRVVAEAPRPVLVIPAAAP